MNMVRYCCTNSNQTTKPKTQSTVKWGDLDKAVLSNRETSQEDNDDLFEDWPDEEPSAPSDPVLEADDINVDDPALIDLTSSMLRGMLVDRPAEPVTLTNEDDGDMDMDTFCSTHDVQVADWNF